MSDQINKKCSNVTIDQMIEHMTADLQASDGQFIQLGFTPPSTPNDQSHSWSEYAQTPSTNNMYQYAMNTNHRMNYPPQLDLRQPTNFVPNMSNTVYLADPMKSMSSGHVDQCPDIIPIIPDLRQATGYIVYNHQNANGTYIQPPQTPDLSPMCSYIPAYSQENHDFGIFMQDQNSVYIENSNSLLQQQQQDIFMKNNTNNSQNSSPQSQNRTPLIENLVGNWTPNTSGTYSPFGNVNHDVNIPPYGKVERNAVTNMKQSNISLHNAANRSNVQKKPRMVAEVKPMRPTYSDVLAKSVPHQSKSIKIDGNGKENVNNKNKNHASNKTGPLKTPSTTKPVNSNATIQTSRQTPSGFDENSSISSEKNNSNASPHHKNIKLPNSTSQSHTDDSTFHSDHERDTKVSNRKTDNNTANKNDKKMENSKKTAPFDSTRSSSATTSSQNYTKMQNSTSAANNNLNFEWRGEQPDSSVKNVDRNFTKNMKKSKEAKSSNGKFSERNNSSTYGVVDKPPVAGRRGHRGHRKRENPNSTLSVLHRSIKQYLHRWSALALYALIWLLHLISDVFSLSMHLVKDLCTNSWDFLKSQSSNLSKTTLSLFSKIRIFARILRYIDDTFGNKWWAFWNRGRKDARNSKSDCKSWHTSGLETNITMPSTGEEAMKRLLACKGKDPYSILGVTTDCTDDDIKRYYKRQAFLVHPDKNPQPGAEEAFKILVHAFDIIGEPERRQSYDRKVAESHQVEQAWNELNDLLSQLHQKMEYAANTIRCTNCTKRHRRIHVDRPCYAARMCAQCKIHHSAKEGDIWAESTCFGFLWYYYACMDGAVYDITEWASCQRVNLRHLRPNTHQVQYRIVLGKQAGGAGQSGSSTNNFHHRHKGAKMERDADLPDLEEFLNNWYQKTGGTSSPCSTSPTADAAGMRSEFARNRKKNKRKK